MDNRRKNLLFLALLIVLLPFAVLFSWPDNRFYFIACDVGQGDAILLTKGFTQVLIDGGPDNKVLTCLSDNMPFWDKKIELLVNTHPDKDHLAGLIEVVKRYQVEKILANSLVVDSQVFSKFHQQVWDKNISVYSPQVQDKIKVGDLAFTVLWPENRVGNVSVWGNRLALADNEDVLGDKTAEKTNINSIVLYLQVNDFTALLTGDIDSKIEEKIIKNFNFSDLEVLKIAHHGSKYSSSEKFLQFLKPKIAVISVGKNPWGHPTQEVLDRLKSVGAKVLRTDIESNIKLSY